MSKQAEFAALLKLIFDVSAISVPTNCRASLARASTWYSAPEEMLVQKGERGDALYGVRRGQIRIETGALDGGRLTLDFPGLATCSARSLCSTARAAAPTPWRVRSPSCLCCGARIS